jgi:hypothetical protein
MAEALCARIAVSSSWASGEAFVSLTALDFAAALVEGENGMEWRSARQGAVIRANGIHGFKPSRRSESNQLATAKGGRGEER